MRTTTAKRRKGKNAVQIVKHSDDEVQFGTTSNGYQWTVVTIDVELLAMIEGAIKEYRKKEGIKIARA